MIKPVQLLLLSLWVFVLVGFCLGVSLPMASIEKFFFFGNEFSLISAMGELLDKPSGQNLFLLMVIFLFTFVFPIAKLMTMLLQIINHGKNWQNRMTRFVEMLGHFSMVDVFVIALMVLLLKLRVMVDVKVHAGFYWFTVSIIVSIALSQAIKYLRQQSISTH